MSAADVLTVNGAVRCWSCEDFSTRPHGHAAGDVTVERLESGTTITRWDAKSEPETQAKFLHPYLGLRLFFSDFRVGDPASFNSAMNEPVLVALLAAASGWKAV